MAKPKEERNRLFLEDWQKGFGNQSLAEKYKLSIGGVKALKQRLRVKDSSLYVEKPPELTRVEEEVGKASSGLIKFAAKIKKPSSKVTSTSTKRMTFWLPGAMIQKIKSLARKQKRTASEIAREVFEDYLKE